MVILDKTGRFWPKNAYFGHFWVVLGTKFINLAAFGHCLVTHNLISIYEHLRIKNIFLLILAHQKIMTDIFSKTYIFLCKLEKTLIFLKMPPF